MWFAFRSAVHLPNKASVRLKYQYFERRTELRVQFGQNTNAELNLAFGSAFRVRFCVREPNVDRSTRKKFSVLRDEINYGGALFERKGRTFQTSGASGQEYKGILSSLRAGNNWSYPLERVCPKV